MCGTKGGTDITGYVRETKAQMKGGGQRNRTCATTGRSMKVEKEVALRYFSLPQFAEANVMSI